MQTATAAIIVAVLAILGIDPLVGVFGSMAGVATVGMVLLMLTTSVAVLVFFLRNRELGTDHLWTTRIAPALAVLGLLGAVSGLAYYSITAAVKYVLQYHAHID